MQLEHTSTGAFRDYQSFDEHSNTQKDCHETLEKVQEAEMIIQLFAEKSCLMVLSCIVISLAPADSLSDNSHTEKGCINH